MNEGEGPQILGWYGHDGRPQLRPGPSDPRWLKEATARHEDAHRRLGSAGAHGIATSLLLELSSTSPTLIEAALSELGSTAFMTSEGFATVVELVFIAQTAGDDGVNMRMASLDLSYRVALANFDPVLAAGATANLSNEVLLLLMSAIALSCCNTFIFEDSGDTGLIDRCARGLRGLRLNPDERLDVIAAQPESILRELAAQVGDMVEYSSRRRPLDSASAAPVVDRAVERWIHDHGLFRVAERVAHAHRQPVVDRAWEATCRYLGLPERVRQSVRTVRMLEYVETVGNRHDFDLEQSRILHFPDQDGLHDWVSHFVLETQAHGVAHLAFALAHPLIGDGGPDDVTLFAVGMAGEPVIDDTAVGKETQFITRPDDALWAATSVSVRELVDFISDDATLALTCERFQNLTADARANLLTLNVQLYVIADRVSLSAIGDVIAGASIRSYELLESPLFGPIVAVLGDEDAPARYVFPVSPAGERLLQDHMERLQIPLVGQSRHETSMQLFLALWHWMYGVLQPQPWPIGPGG